MTPRGRTNQLLYQAELLLETPGGDDEHAPSRRLAAQEAVLALTELALDSLLREVTEHARLARHDWRELLGSDAEPLAELAWLRELAARPDGWLAGLLARLDALHDLEGAARRAPPQAPALIATAERPSLDDELRWYLREFKALLPGLRETSVEW